MFISHWLFPVTVLGPGNRLAIWIQGCSRNCEGCIAPELQQRGVMEYDVFDLADTFNSIVQGNQLDGITISGGEPVDQLDDLIRLTENLNCKDILLYTGYNYEEIKDDILCRLPVDVVITGPYVKALDDDSPLYGSSNQELVFLNKSLKKKYIQYIEKSKRQQELFIMGNTLYTAGLASKETEGNQMRKIEEILKENLKWE